MRALRGLGRASTLGCAVSLVLCLTGRARGQQQHEPPPRVSATNFTSLQYRVDNRNTSAGSVQSLSDDDWGLLHNRLNAQVTTERWHVGARVDAAWFYDEPSARGIALELLERRRGDLAPPFSSDDNQFFALKQQEAERDLATRYQDVLYPSKYFVGYRTRDIAFTAGDVSAQFGRGLVLSLRKQDELVNDTTVRGLHLVGNVRGADVHLRATALGGVINPLRLDEASGRVLTVSSAVTPGPLRVLDYGMPRPGTGEAASTVTLAPDRIAGGQLELRVKRATLAFQSARLFRQPALSNDSVRDARAIQTSSISVDLPQLWHDGSLYLESAMQHRQPGALPSDASTGHAVYTALTSLHGPWLFTLEGKHYRSFLPLLANVDVSRAPELSTLQYNAPPTTEAHWVDTEFGSHNTCVSGGRAKVDHAFTPHHSAGVWLGHYRSWAESVSNERCSTADDNLNRIWDVASTFELRGERGGWRDSFVLGARLDETARALPDPRGGRTQIFYSESYARYDSTHRLVGRLSLQLRGWHRRRLQTQGGPGGTFFQGDHSTGVRFGSVSVALGTEYDADPRTPDFYLNGSAQYDFGPSSNVALFVGQRRGGLRCVNGVCRAYAPFEGARVDLTLEL